MHHEPAALTRPTSFRRFLCDSPLVRESEYDHTTGKQKHLGSYHQMYRLDGRLIAMGVLDLLPNCVSGVYFIYHADFEKYSFGKLSALREATVALEDGYGYYYMGYYIHSCAKMKYKGDYQPQYFLDLDDFSWAPLDAEALALMERQKYVSMTRERLNTQRHPESRAVDAGGGDTPMDDYAEDVDAVAPPFDNAAQAEESGMSTLQIGMPGVLTVQEVVDQVDLDDINVQVGLNVVTKTSVST